MTREGRKTILLVEDEVVIAMSEARQLEKVGFEVLQASNGEKAIELACAPDSGIDLILMDIDLGPGMDGAEAARTILEHRDLPIIFLSSHTEKEIVGKTGRITNYGYVVKGSGFTVLDASIKMSFLLFEADLRVRKSERNYQLIFENSGTANAIFDTECRLVMLNGLAKRYLGASDGSVGKSVLEISDAAQGPLLTERMRQVLASGRSVDFESPHLLSDGERWFRTSYLPVFDLDRRVVGVQTVSREITAERRSELALREGAEQVRRLLAEKELLLREVHHRIENNMNSIHGLLSFQAGFIGSGAAKEILEDAAGRVRSMGLLYDMLYRRQPGVELPLREYLPPLVEEVLRMYPSRDKVVARFDIDHVALDERKLSPVGIIVYELVSNSMKHAFADREAGCVSLSVKREGRRVRLVCADDGVGMPEAARLDGSKGFGMHLVGTLAGKMGGGISMDGREGTVVTLDFEAT